MCRLFVMQDPASYTTTTPFDRPDAEHRRFTELGFSPNPIKEFMRDGSLMARFFFVQDPDGYKVEVLQRHGRYQ